MQPRRSDQEYIKRHEDRETLAKSVAGAFKHGSFSAKPKPKTTESEKEREKRREDFANSPDANTSEGVQEILKEEQEESKREASAQEQNLSRSAVHFASNQLKDVGLHTITLAPSEVEVIEEVTGPKLQLIKSASVKLAATIPVVKAQHVTKKPFFVNLSFSDGKFSVDSFEKNRQLFAVNKGSMTKLATMPDSEAVQGPPTNEEHLNDDANSDVLRNAEDPEEPKKKFSNPFVEKEWQEQNAPQKKVKLELVGLDGNAFSLLGAFQKAARRQGWSPEEIKPVMDEAMSGDYNHLLQTLMKYTDSPEGEEDENEFEMGN